MNFEESEESIRTEAKEREERGETWKRGRAGKGEVCEKTKVLTERKSLGTRCVVSQNPSGTIHSILLS
jgi:hypothetical protein